MNFIPFAELMERPDVVALATGLFMTDGMPVWLAKFMAVTMACSPTEPEGDLPNGYAGSSCCVFWVEQYDDGPTGRYEPWTCALNLGASLSFVFSPVQGDEPGYDEDDSWGVPPEGPVTTDSLGWNPTVHAMLERSLWTVLREPSTLPA